MARSQHEQKESFEEAILRMTLNSYFHIINSLALSNNLVYTIINIKIVYKKGYFLFVNEFEEQRYGRNKNTTINHTYINGGEFRKKFDNISNNPNLNRLLYQLAKQMLNHRSGTLYEDMYWIDLDKISVIASELTCDTEEQIIYSKATIQIISSHDNLLTVHSHPNSFPPSIGDLNSNFEHRYKIGIIICHNGKIYMYAVSEKINENYYKILSI